MPAELKKPVATAAEPEFWQSVDTWMESPQFEKMMKDEFPEDAGEWLDPVSRRSFLALSAASVALATGCNPSIKPMSRQNVVPFVKQPEGWLPGVPLFFATAMAQQGGVGLGLIVKQHEGRPIKVEGNPNQSSSLGSTNLMALAAPLDMYDPDRSKNAVTGNARATTTFEKAVLAVKAHLAKAGTGKSVRLLTEPTTSPTQIALIEKFLAQYPDAKWLQYEPVTRDNPRRASKAAFGKVVNPIYDFTKADVILALDSDFLTVGPGSVRYARDFGARRRVSTVDATHELEKKAGKHVHDEAKILDEATKHLNRLYVVEAMTTSAGTIADHRLPLKPSQVEAFARALAVELKVEGVSAEGELPELAKKWIPSLARDLLANKAKSIVVVGDHQSPAVHLIAWAINKKLESFGATVTFTESVETVKGDKPLPGWPGDVQFAALAELVADMNAGKVDCLLMSGVNPCYDAPADLEFIKALDAVLNQKNALIVHHGLYQDETALKATWHLNAPHFLESWGDLRGHDGTLSVVQPLIAPLYNSKSFIEFLATILPPDLAKKPEDISATDGMTLVKGTFRKLLGGDEAKFEIRWQEGLKAGSFEGTAFAPIKPEFKLDAAAFGEKGFRTPAVSELEVQFRPDPAIFDGKQANNGWLQELPKPITNLCWDNAAILSPRTAEKLKILHGYTFNTYRGGERGCTETDIVELTVNGRNLKIAVHVLTGHADDVITLHLGFGRTRCGDSNISGRPIACPVDGHVPGFNTYALRTSDGVWNAPAKLERTNQRYFLAIAGAHAAMESRRPVRTASKAQFINDDEFAQIPPVAAAEFELIRANTPGTPENFAQVFEWNPKNKDGTKNLTPHPHPYAPHHDGEAHEPHDRRLIPLNLYNANPIQVNGGSSTKNYRRWAMTIDLGSCIGCSACTLACVAENNIPVVGKEQVHRGRAMHWIRIDRYYSIPTPGKLMSDEYGDSKVNEPTRKQRAKESENIKIHVQPVPCQQCEKAPCEVVCPVGATVHSADGLNDMAYNRCVGTRYCSNNCPYKVRRFNFLQYTDYTTDSLKLLNNPEVTVRTRGVMEKCTYCVQRIRNAEIEAEREWTTRPRDAVNRPKIFDGEILTACQQACPTQAIHFGDLNDPASLVLKTKAEPHNYGLLAELNTMPRTSYLAAIKNPNPELEAALLSVGKGA